MSDEADGIMNNKTLFLMVDGGSGHSHHRKDPDGPWQQNHGCPRERMSPANLRLWARSWTKEKANMLLIAETTTRIEDN